MCKNIVVFFSHQVSWTLQVSIWMLFPFHVKHKSVHLNSCKTWFSFWRSSFSCVFQQCGSLGVCFVRFKILFFNTGKRKSAHTFEWSLQLFLLFSGHSISLDFSSATSLRSCLRAYAGWCAHILSTLLQYTSSKLAYVAHASISTSSISW